MIAVFNDEEWRTLCHVMGQPGLGGEEKYSTVSKRKAEMKELDEIISRWTSKNKPETVMRLLQDAGVPAGVVQNAEDMANDPHLRARDFFIHLEHPVFGDTISRSSLASGQHSPLGFQKPQGARLYASTRISMPGATPTF